MHMYVTGQLYHPNRTSWPEAVEYNYREGGHALRLFFTSPDPGEVEGAAVGTAEFALLVERDALFLLFQFGGGEPGVGLPWADASYNWWLNPPEMRTLPNPEPDSEERALLSVFLIDAATGILRAQRALTFSSEFTRALHAAIRKQSRTAWEGPAAYGKALDRLYRRYPDPTALLAAASVHCQGGE